MWSSTPPSGAPPAQPGTSQLKVKRDSGEREQLVPETVTRLEDLLCAVALLTMAALPLLEMSLRTFWGQGISGSATGTQHLVLWVAFLGAAVAAREGQLLSLATESLLPARVSAWAKLVSGGVGCSVCLVLALAAVVFVQAERMGGQILAFEIPAWVAQTIIPAGFALIGIRLLWRCSPSWRGRVAAASILAVPLAIWLGPDVHDTFVPWLCLLFLFLAAALGAPIFVGLGGAAAILLWSGAEPISAIPVEVYNLTVKPLLPTIPLFTLAGYLLASGGTPRRLVGVFRALVGWAPGGVAVVAIIACAFFTSFTGGSGVTIVALGGLLYPMLIQEEYRDRMTTGLLTSAGSLGLLLPPSLAVILYSVVAQVDVRRLFVGGLFPAGIEIALVIAYVTLWARRAAAPRTPFELNRAIKAVMGSIWELSVPILVMVCIIGGIATLVETAAITVLYTFVLEFFIRRNLSVRKDLLRVVGDASVLIGGVLVILGVAMGLTNYLVIEQVPDAVTAWVQSFVESPLVFLLLLNLCLLLVGCLMDIYSAITVMVPLLAPIGLAFGVDPIHMGVIFLINLELGYLTPPVGMNLFLASYRFERRLDEVYRAALPFLGIRVLAVVLVTYIPELTLWLPRMSGLGSP